MHRPLILLALALAPTATRAASPINTHAVVPEDGPFFEPLQTRDAADIDTQLNFEIDLTGSFQAARIEEVRVTWLDTLNQPIGEDIVVGVDDLRSFYLHHGDRNGFGAGRDGFVRLDLSGGPEEWTDTFVSGSVYAVGNRQATAVLPDGTFGTIRTMVATRHDRDGRDAEWIRTVVFPKSAASYATSALNTGERMLMAGSVTPWSTGKPGTDARQFAFALLHRPLDTEGKLDGSFAGDGMLAVPVTGCHAQIEDLVTSEDRKGREAWIGIGDLDCGTKGGLVGLVKVLQDGSLDKDFGLHGMVQLASSLGSVRVRGGVRDAKNGWIYVVGQLGVDMMVARFDEQGVVDASWGTSGFLPLAMPDLRDVIAYEAQVLADGRVVVAGDGTHIQTGERRMVVAMVEPTGGYHQPFHAGAGYLSVSFATDAWARDVAVSEADDRIWLSGFVEEGRDDGFAVAAATLWGDLVPDFAQEGLLVVPFPEAGAKARSFGMTVQGPDRSAADRYGAPVARDFLTLVGGASGALAAIQVDATDGTLDDNALLTRFSRRVLWWPDTGVVPEGASHEGTALQWDALPYAARIEADLVDPFTGAALEPWVQAVQPRKYVQDHELWFPARASELDASTSEHWYLGQAHHVDNNHRGQSTYHIGDDRHYSGQRYAYDLTVRRWTGASWVEQVGDVLEANEDSLVYGKTVYPQREGWLVWCTDGVVENSKPNEYDGAENCDMVDLDGDGELDCLYFGGGNEVRLQHPDGSVTMYAHMQPGMPLCPHGQGRGPVEPAIWVTRDTPLGLVGNSGSSSGPHLHTEVHRPWDPTLDDYTKSDGRPLLWENVRSMRTSGGPDDFLTPWERIAPHGSSILQIVDSFWQPPATDCDLVDAFSPGPDGDFSVDRYCDDSEGEAVCVAQDGGAWGQCVRCADDPSAPGCLCQDDEQCGVGQQCYATDAANGFARGRCYDELPWWQCSVVCEDVLGTGATCMNDHPIGVGHCLDQLTDPWLAEQCLQPPNELPAIFGECAAECTPDQACTDLGYPAWFVCGTDLGMLPFCLDPFRL